MTPDPTLEPDGTDAAGEGDAYDDESDLETSGAIIYGFPVSAATAGDADDPAETAVFDDDTGTLTLDQRRTVIRLLKYRYITPDRHPAEWRTLLEHTDLIRSRMHDLMLDIRIDTDRGVAYKLQVELDGTPTPRLLADRGYTREETIILWFLRTRLRSDQAAGNEASIVDTDEILDRVDAFRPATSTDKKADRAKADAAIGRLTDARILLKTADPARLQIAPVLATLLPLDQLRTLTQRLITLNTGDLDTAQDDLDTDGDPA